MEALADYAYGEWSNKDKIVLHPILELTPESFAPFGDVISIDAAQQHFPINQGTTERYHRLTQVEVLGENPQAIISIFRAQSRSIPIEINTLEQHPFGSQAFMPLTPNPYLVAVAEANLSNLCSSDVSIFWCHPHQGVNYRVGVWHHALLALTDHSDFLVIDYGGSEHNCVEKTLQDAPIFISAQQIEAYQR